MAKDGSNRGGARPGAGRKRKTLAGTFEHLVLCQDLAQNKMREILFLN